MKKNCLAQAFLTISIPAAILITPAAAQLGDRKGHNMVDPIPADKIPPSPYLSLEETLKEFKIAPGYVIEPVASGEDVHLSIALSFDGNGRAWSCEMRSYMPDIDGNGEDTPNGRIRVLEDTDGDGKVDKATTFLDGLILPRAVAVTGDGCLYTSAKTLYFIKRDGIKPIGEPIIVDAEYSIGGNPEHSANGLLYGHDNWYYSAKSKNRYRRINGKWVKDQMRLRGQWGISKDNAGRLFYNSNSVLAIGDVFPPMFLRSNPHYKPKARVSPKIGSSATNPLHITPGANRAYQQKTLDEEGRLKSATAACGITIYRGDNFPAETQGMAFIAEPVGDLIKAVKVKRNTLNYPTGSHPYGENSEFLASTDEWFAPCNLYTAPDGTLWVVDMYFGLIQHKGYVTSYLRKQYLSRNLDKPGPSTGRIYRIRYEKNNLSPVPRMEGMPAADIIPFLSHANGTIRDIAQRLIVESGDTSLSDPLTQVVAESTNPWGKIHALWALDGLGQTNAMALIHGLKSGNPDVINSTLDICSRNKMGDVDVQKAILSLEDQPNTLHARIKAMASIDLADEAMSLALASKNIPFVAEVFISGLGEQTVAFRKKHTKITDLQLDQLLTKAAKATQQALKHPTIKKTPGSHLEGIELKSFMRGKEFYTQAGCLGCHGSDGEGQYNMGLGPPLDKSEWATGDPERLAKILLHGMEGPLKVNGKKYNPPTPMPGLAQNKSITNQDLADVMNYIRNAWNNRSSGVTAKFVEEVRDATKNQFRPYQANALENINAD